MTLVLALAGWLAAAALLAIVVVLRRRLELVASAEHELRGPAAALTLALEATRAGLQTDLVASQLDRVRLGLADLEAARSGRRAAAEPSSVSLERVVGRAAAGWRTAAGRAGGRLELDWAAAGPVQVRADPRRLSQALGNVLANAVEHGRGSVMVRGSRFPRRVRVEVADEGPGFSAAPTGPDRRSGRGRGLRIAAQAIEEAGGSLSVSSGETGAVVALELPVAEP